MFSFFFLQLFYGIASQRCCRLGLRLWSADLRIRGYGGNTTLKWKNYSSAPEKVTHGAREGDQSVGFANPSQTSSSSPDSFFFFFFFVPLGPLLRLGKQEDEKKGVAGVKKKERTKLREKWSDMGVGRRKKKWRSIVSYCNFRQRRKGAAK